MKAAAVKSPSGVEHATDEDSISTFSDGSAACTDTEERCRLLETNGRGRLKDLSMWFSVATC